MNFELQVLSRTPNSELRTPNSELRTLNSKLLLSWYQRHKRPLPWRKTRDPYAIFVSEIMLQQTQVKTVLPYYKRWMETFPTIKSLAVGSEEEALKLWEGLGYYRRARMLHSAAKQIVDQHNGRFPKNLDEIADLPGVGRYTMGAVASIAFNLPTPIVDGNVIRVLSRWFGIDEIMTSSVIREKIWPLAEKLIPTGKAGDFNQSMMELGAMVCTPSTPSCLLCPVRKGCWAFSQSAQHKIPNLPPRIAAIQQYEYAGLARHNSKILLYQRPAGQRMEKLWQFPSVTLKEISDQWTETWKEQFIPFRRYERLTKINYTVTHHRIRLEFFKLDGIGSSPTEGTQWVNLEFARKLPFTAAHRKLADQFLLN